MQTTTYITIHSTLWPSYHYNQPITSCMLQYVTSANDLYSIIKFCLLYQFFQSIILPSWWTRNTFCRTWYLPQSRVHKFMAELCSNFGDSAINKGQIAYFSLRMRKTPIFLLPVKNLTSPSCSLTPISYKMKEFSAIRPQVRAKSPKFLHLMRNQCQNVFLSAP